MEFGQPSQRDHAATFYERLLFVLRNAPALLPLAMVPVGLTVRLGLANDNFYGGGAAFLIVVGAYVAASALYLVYKWRHELEESQLVDFLFTLVFHLLVVLFMLFVSGFLSIFLAAWIVLMVNADIRFGIKGFLASFLALCVAALIFVGFTGQLDATESSQVFQVTVTLGVLSFAVARVRALTDRERSDLARTREDESYQRERLLALVNSMGDAMAATDEQGIIKVYNSTMINLLDTNIDLHEKSLDDVLQLTDNDNRPISLIAEAKTRKTVFSRSDLSHKLSDNDSIKLYVNVAPIQPGYQSRAERGYIVILRDITKEKSLEEERDEFVSVVSHELRTPVTIAEGNLSNIKLMFERGSDKQTEAKAVDDAHQQIMYLAKLVNDLSTLAKAERGTGGKNEVIDLNSMLQELHKEYDKQAVAKKLQFNLDVAPGLPKINANLLYLEEIMQNLITNSIKYTQQGSITLRATADKTSISLEVSDTGIGISKTDQTHVFEKFYRSEDYRTRESSGTGLGLYVCKKLAEKQGFKVQMQSRLNHGSTFSLIIPMSRAVADQSRQAVAPNAVPAK